MTGEIVDNLNSNVFSKIEQILIYLVILVIGSFFYYEFIKGPEIKANCFDEATKQANESSLLNSNKYYYDQYVHAKYTYIQEATDECVKNHWIFF